MTKQFPVEGDVKAAIKKLLTEHGWFWFMPPANMYGKSGISDILAVRQGLFMAIEVKLKKKTGTPNQIEFMRQVREHGGVAILVNQEKLPQFQRLLEEISHG